jgi:replicative DNA helicase
MRDADKPPEPHTTPLAHYFDAAFKASENAAKRGNLSGLTTGFPAIDSATGGLGTSQLWTIGGGTGSGKSSLALALARNVVGAGLPGGGTPDVYFASLEMGAIPIVHRLAAMTSNLCLLNAMRGCLTPAEWGQYAEALNMERAPATFIHMDIRDYLTIADVRGQLRIVKDKPYAHLGLAIVDYMQLLSPQARSNNREREVSEVVRGLKGLAQEFEIPVVGCSQFSRAANTATDINLGHLRESGEIEQASDVVILIVGSDDSAPGVMNMKIGKNRFGPKIGFQLSWNPACTRFGNLTKREDAPVEAKRSGWAGYDD